MLWNPTRRLVALAILAGCTACQPKPKSTMTIQTENPSHTNRLAREKSPYLLQHAHNPVDWYPWGDEAFEKARKENKPIFLSIGYSTCHWCHVMERESFENEGLAKFLNEHFVSIKVDREERPDIDKIYMTAVQAMTGSGGWPMSVFLTPDRKPFYGGTYFPPESRRGQLGFLDLLQRIHHAWTTEHEGVLKTSAEFSEQLRQFTSQQTNAVVPLNAQNLRQAAGIWKEEYDPRHGGFGSAPKFPQPSQPRFLLQAAHRFNDSEALQMVLHTCDRMAAGGIYDQVGGGFSRYSVDAEWLVPHFEKMLYDNAQLTQLYLDAHVLTGDARHARVAREIIEYVLRDMRHRDGGFYSAEDADSEGKEGKFYAWTKTELAQILSPEDFELAVRTFGITERGNFVDHSDPHPLPNLNVLSIVRPPANEGEKERLEKIRARLFKVRSRRVRPHLDDKVLTSWNGLMLGAMARAGIVLNEPRFLEAAEKNLNFLKSNLWDSTSKALYHRWRDGSRDNTQLFEDYAYLLSGTIDLYEATLNPAHLEFAMALADGMIQRFFDREHGGFWQAPAAASDLILRVKEDYDGAEPSPNSVAVLALLKLGAMTERADLKQAAEKTLHYFSARIEKFPQAVSYMMMALDFYLQEPRRAVIAGDPAAGDSKKLLHSVHSTFQPNKVVLGNHGLVEPFARTLPMQDNQATLYVCTGTACQPPTRDTAKVRDLLK